MRKVILSLALIAVGFFNKEVNSATCGSKTKSECKRFCKRIFRNYLNCFYNPSSGHVFCKCGNVPRKSST